MEKPLLEVEDLQKYFEDKPSFFSKKPKKVTKAVDRVSFSVKKGDVLVLAGESGSGKTTILNLLMGTITPYSGKIVFDGEDIHKNLKKIRLECQVVQQDPYASIDPRMKVVDIVKEPLDIHKIGNDKKRLQLVYDALREVRLDPPQEIGQKYPHMLSGGQRQRVVIARALATRPKMIIADEPVSMLDVSVRAEILELLDELKQKHGITFIYITHDLATARYFGNKIAVLYTGKIVEFGPIDKVLFDPKHPYTQALIDAIPDPDPGNLYKQRIIRIKEPTQQTSPVQGCNFIARCPYAIEKCNTEPALEKIGEGWFVACFVRPEFQEHTKG